MLTKLIITIARISLGGKILEIINGLHERTVGHRTEILIGLECVTEALLLIGIIDKSIADPIKVALLGAMAPTLAEKVKRAQESVENVIPK